jgi:hypothetical protein
MGSWLWMDALPVAFVNIARLCHLQFGEVPKAEKSEFLEFEVIVW